MCHQWRNAAPLRVEEQGFCSPKRKYPCQSLSWFNYYEGKWSQSCTSLISVWSWDKHKFTSYLKLNQQKHLYSHSPSSISTKIICIFLDFRPSTWFLFNYDRIFKSSNIPNNHSVLRCIYFQARRLPNLPRASCVVRPLNFVNESHWLFLRPSLMSLWWVCVHWWISFRSLEVLVVLMDNFLFFFCTFLEEQILSALETDNLFKIVAIIKRLHEEYGNVNIFGQFLGK